MADSKTLHRYDDLFNALRTPAVPLQYLQAIAYKESAMNPGDVTGSNPPHVGLFQVSPEVARDWASAGSGAYSPSTVEGAKYRVKWLAESVCVDDLKDARLNTRIFLWWTAKVRKLLADLNVVPARLPWEPGYFELLYQGWNSGWSPSGGLLKVVKFLRSKGWDVTPENVRRYAGVAKATPLLTLAAKVKYQRETTQLYQQLVNLGDALPANATEGSDYGWVILIGLALLMMQSKR